MISEPNVPFALLHFLYTTSAVAQSKAHRGETAKQKNDKAN